MGRSFFAYKSRSTGENFQVNVGMGKTRSEMERRSGSNGCSSIGGSGGGEAEARGPAGRQKLGPAGPAGAGGDLRRAGPGGPEKRRDLRRGGVAAGQLVLGPAGGEGGRAHPPQGAPPLPPGRGSALPGQAGPDPGGTGPGPERGGHGPLSDGSAEGEPLVRTGAGLLCPRPEGGAGVPSGGAVRPAGGGRSSRGRRGGLYRPAVPVQCQPVQNPGVPQPD